jgi:hypothetical protein
MCRPFMVRLAMVKKFAAEQSVMTHRLFCFSALIAAPQETPLLNTVHFLFIESVF